MRLAAGASQVGHSCLIRLKSLAFEIVAHRGAPNPYPENSLPAFEQAIQMGANAVDFDVRLTADRIPVVYHYYYLDNHTTGSGLLANYSYSELCDFRVLSPNGTRTNLKIPSLIDVLDHLKFKTGLEIEGPEPEAPSIVANVLKIFQDSWEQMEITSYEPIFLLEVRSHCPNLNIDLLLPRSEFWMGADVIRYIALHRARQVSARAIHLHPEQITTETVIYLRQANIETHL